MASTFENNLRLEEMGTGENSGTWGTKTNVNLELITDSLSYSSTGEAIANASTHTITMADGVADEFRSLYLKCTGGGQACTVTLAPNTLSKVWLIENTTSATLTFSQGSGANIAILAGQVKMVATDGAGSGAAVFDLMQDLAVPDLFVDDDLTLQSDSAVLGFGADKDTTLTHTDGSGLTLNSTNKIMFRDAALSISSSADATLDLAADGDINLTAGVDINIPANVGLTFGNDAEKIEGDGTDLTITGNNINLTAVADVVVPANVGITFGTGEKIEGDNTDITVTSGADINLTATTDINVPSGVGMTFGDDGEKIEGNGTDLTINASNDLNLTATTDINIPANVGLTFGDDGEKIEGDGTNLAINSSGDVNITATTVDLDGNLEVSGTITLGSGAVISEAELELLDGVTAGTAIASKVVTTDANIDTTGQRNLTITGELDAATGDFSSNVDIDGDLLVGDDLTLDSDAAVLGFGADTDVTLTHVADTGLLLNSTMAIQFNDASQFINAPSATVLDINATDEIELNATLVDINANVDISGTLGVTGIATFTDDIIIGDGKTIGSASDVDAMTIASNGQVTFTQTLIGTALDISGDIDVDGTTNLDVVDIDGAVDMASTLTLAGNADFNGDLDVDGTTNLDAVDVDGAVNFAADVTFADGADIITASAGTSNFRAGVNAGNSIVSGGNYNVVVGDEAGTALTTGDNNVAIGYGAFDSATDQQDNVAIGYNALTAITASGGTLCTAVGSQALAANTAGYHNVAIGYAASDANTHGIRNVSMGRDSLGADTKGSLNVAIGDSTLAAQNFTTATDGQNTAVGAFAGTAMTTGIYNVMVGAEAGDAMTDADGNVAIGWKALTSNTLGHGSTAVGAQCLHNQNYTTSTNAYNTCVGHSAGYSISTGTFNVCIGGLAGDNATTGNFNTFVGASAGDAVTTGFQNTFVGHRAGDALTDSDYNCVVGQAALTTDTLGSRTTAIGTFALFSQNQTTATITGNTAVGYSAGNDVSTGAADTFVGYLSGANTTTGGFNTFLGYQAGIGSSSTAHTGDENTVVGAEAGTNIQGDADQNTMVGRSSGLDLTTGDNNLFLGHDAGRTGSPGGSITTGSNEIVLGDENISEAHIQVDWTVASDQRDKTDFTALDLGLDFVKGLKPVTYKWDKRSKYVDKDNDNVDLDTIVHDGTHKEDWLDIGFKAQEVEALEAAAGYAISDKTNLTTNLSEDGKQMGLQYSKFVPILVKAIQEQNVLIEALTARVAELEG